jgi:hypothetical protein
MIEEHGQKSQAKAELHRETARRFKSAIFMARRVASCDGTWREGVKQALRDQCHDGSSAHTAEGYDGGGKSGVACLAADRDCSSSERRGDVM